MTLFRGVVLAVLFAACPGRTGHAQPQSGGSGSKVTWEVRGDTVRAGQSGTIIFQASIAEHWKMYAPGSPPPTVGVAVTVRRKGRGIAAVDSLEHAGATQVYDPNFGKPVRFFSGDARLRLPVRVAVGSPSGAHPVGGTIRFMVCTDEICLPPATTSFETVLQVPANGSSESGE